MAASSVKTVQFVDPRIEPQPDPLYDYIIGPVQNQYYKIGSSGLSNSSITFNNLTTLGVDRAYLDTFEIELTAEIKFYLKTNCAAAVTSEIIPNPDEFVFQSFPFNTCCDEARINVNGGAFFSQPMSYIRAKERYMNQRALSECYANVCPCHKPLCQTESARYYFDELPANNNEWTRYTITSTPNYYSSVGYPTRLGAGMMHYMQSDQGMSGGFNNAIISLGKKRMAGGVQSGWENLYRTTEGGREVTVLRVTWREPLFCSPFSSRYDATYGRPLYNITSMDFAFTLMNLGNMLRVVNLRHNTSTTAAANESNWFVDSYTVDIKSAQLCYQVMTIPKSLKKPITTLVPYRRFVPYITEFPSTLSPESDGSYSILSGVYTLNEVPTAIWVFCAPVKQRYQENTPDSFGNAEYTITDGGTTTHYPCTQADGNWDSNKLFAYMTHVNISMANTTQILNTAEVRDLYRIAKANGCEDSFQSWANIDTMFPKNLQENNGGATSNTVRTMYQGAGSVLRLKPGIDLIVPDTALIPGANAKNMVFQVRANFRMPPFSSNQNKYALWLLFEYVGVASISPGQCEITMNPVGGGEIMGVSPVMSVTNENTEGTLDGAGFWDKANRKVSILRHTANDNIISRLMNVPGGKQAVEWAEAHGFEPGAKRTRGGAVIGRGLSDWV